MMANSPETAKTAEKSLTEEQEEFLKLLEEEFKDRYTEADEEFKFVWQRDMPPPPILVDWDKLKGNRFGNYESRNRQRPYPYHQRGYNRYEQRGYH